MEPCVWRAVTATTSEVRRHGRLRAVAVAIVAGCWAIGALTGCTAHEPVAATAPLTTAAADSAAAAASTTGRTRASSASTTRRPSVTAAAIHHPPPVVVRMATPGAALVLLQALPVKGRAPMTGYSRQEFGSPWKDVDGNGCDTRDDILAMQLVNVARLDDCRVGSGGEADPYTGAALAYRRGHSTVDIDHVESLGDAWQTGAQQLSLVQRTQLANDPLNLLAVSASANRQKGDADAASWLPRVKSYRCPYVARQVSVKRKYQLWVTRAEHDAIAAILAGCPAQSVPVGAASRAAAPASTTPRVTPTPTRTSTPPPAPTRTSTSPPAPTPAAPTPAASAPAPPASVYYANCTAARAAGAAPIQRGQPGYRPALDRDDDGVACEN